MFSTRSGDVLRALRGGERPETLAAAIGVSVASIYKYEGGQIPQPRIRIKLAAYYGKTVDEIFGDTIKAAVGE